MMIQSGKYLLNFPCGGIEVAKDNKVLYFNRRPMYAFIKTALSITEFYDAPYDKVSENSGKVAGTRHFEIPHRVGTGFP